MRLDVTDASTTADDATIRGAATGAARTYGVYGNSSSTTLNASGVKGEANGAGAVNGVWGVSSAAAGSGLYGLASSATGTGIFGSIMQPLVLQLVLPDFLQALKRVALHWHLVSAEQIITLVLQFLV